MGETGRERGPGATRNELSGDVTGVVVQAGTIHQVVLPPAAELPVPRQLPPAVRDFAGRDHQLAALDALLVSEVESRPAATVISALDGTAGVGKTALAVQWAHRVEHRFGDGTLFANLRGYGPSSPLDPNLVLTSFLHVFGVGEDRLPAEPDAQVGLYRSLLAGRRVLILLDNASTSEQVRPLLPGAPGCLVLVTSRASLTGLAVAEAASRVTLGLFTTAEAETLLRSVLGPERVAAEPGAVADLIDVCARLPLALRIAATRISTRPHVRIADVVQDIADGRNRLDVLSSDADTRSAMRPVFDWSFTQLPADQARLFRRLGLHPGVEFGVPAAAVVAGIDAAAAYRQLEALADVHLVEAVGGRRYRFHDLLHAYAADRAEQDDDPGERHVAMTRLFTWYARTARAADGMVFPGLATLDVTLEPVGEEIALTGRAQALAWLNTEQVNLALVQRAAHRHGAFDVALCLAATARFLGLRGRALLSARLDAETFGLHSARASRNRRAEAFLLGFRGDTFADLGRLDEAETDFGRLLVLAGELEDEVRQRIALVGLGQVRLLQLRYSEALDYYGRALPLARKAGGRPEAVVECNLCRIYLGLGRYEEALAHAERELELRREAEDRVGEAYALCDVALARQGLGDHDGAIHQADRAVAIYRELAGTGAYLVLALETAASSLEQRGDLSQAAAYVSEAASILEELDDPRAEPLRERARELTSRADHPEPR
jgi:tetratricopeptide (TPR) repeat protein